MVESSSSRSAPGRAVPVGSRLTKRDPTALLAQAPLTEGLFLIREKGSGIEVLPFVPGWNAHEFWLSLGHARGITMDEPGRILVAMGDGGTHGRV